MNDAQHEAWSHYLNELAELLQLRDWMIELQRECAPSGAWAHVEVCREHKTAWVQVAWPEFFDTRKPERQRIDMVHELIHVHLDRPQQMMNDLAEMFDENTATKFAKERHRIETEIATESLARVIAPFMPMPPARKGVPMTTPTGLIKTKIPNVTATVHWEDISRYDKFIERGAASVGWPVDRVRAHIAIESQGFAKAKQTNPSNGDSFGLLQIVPYGVGWDGWDVLVKQKAGLPANASRQKVIDALYDPAINIAVGVAILESYYQQYGSLDKASSAFFTGRSDWGAGDTVNGTTGKQYQAAMNGLITEQRLFGDVIDRLFGNRPYEISAEYGQPVTWQCPIGIDPGRPGNCYEYQKAYGLDDVHHWAYDVAAAAGDGAPLYAPFNGVVVCAGTGVGSGAWGTGCAAFGHLNNYGGLPGKAGSGRLELWHEDGDRSLIIGHVLSSRVNPGDRVQAGDLIGQQGGMNASHVHLEGRFASGKRIGDPRVLFPSEDLVTAPPKAERLPIPQPEEFETTVTVTVTADELPVLQRADLSAAVVGDPLHKGDTFNAVYQAVGNDGRIYWVSDRAGRVPVEGTTAPDWKGGGASDDADLVAAAVRIEDTRQKVNALLQGLVSTLEEAA